MNADIVVVGGGIVGASFALQLAASDLQIIVVDRKPVADVALDGDFDHRVYALTPANLAMLERLNLFQPQDRARLTPIRAMEIFGDKQAQLTFSARDVNRNELAVMIEHRLLAQRVNDQLTAAANIQFLSDANLKSIEPNVDSVSLTLEDGTKIDAALVVGADGAKSWVREQCGFSTKEKDFAQVALVANFRCEKGHGQVARQWFADGGVLAWLPLAENIISIVWSMPAARADELYNLPSDAFCRAVEVGGKHCLGVMQLVSPAARFPLVELRNDKLISSRVALIGDAAHVIHPLAGQGLNLGLQDAAALAQVLSEKSVAQGIGDVAVLRRFERSRKESLLTMRAATGGLHGLFALDSSIAAAIRNTGMSLVDKAPWLKQTLMRHAIG